LWVHGAATQLVAGNVIFENPVGVVFDNGPAVVEHNTFVYVPGDPAAAYAVDIGGGSQRAEVRRNVFVTSATVQLRTGAPEAIVAMDLNAYGPIAPSMCQQLVGTEMLDFAAWQALGFDQGSQCAAIDGVSPPPTGSTADDWADELFFAPLTPDESFWGCDEAVGAFDCNGTRQGLEILPLGEHGFGWEGTIDVWQRYDRASGP
jgi:hypothetical protein